MTSGARLLRMTRIRCSTTMLMTHFSMTPFNPVTVSAHLWAKLSSCWRHSARQASTLLMTRPRSSLNLGGARPPQSTSRYLGAQITHESFEDATVHRRLTTARAKSSLWPLTSHPYQQKQPFFSVQAGVVVHLCRYMSVLCLGLKRSYAHGLQKVRVLVQKQFRPIARLPIHITHLSNQDGIEEPGAHILRNMQGLLFRWQGNQESECPIPVKAQEDI